MRLLQQCLLADPNNAYVHYLLSICFREADKLTEATEHAQAAIAADPESWIGHHALALTLLARNRFAEADAAIDEAIRLNSEEVENFALKSQLRFLQSDWRGALDAADQGLKLEPSNESCANLRGMALRQMRQHSTAEDEIRATLARDPDNSLTHANLGWSLLERGNAKEALKHFQEALRLEPNSEFAREGLIHALRSHYIIYRWLFAYFAWVSKLGKHAWVILIGGYLGYRLLAGLAKSVPALAPFIWPITTAYIVFALSTWLVVPLTNLLLITNRYGRYALRREQKIFTFAVAACLCVGMILIGSFLFSSSGPIHLLALGIMVGLLALPVAGTVYCDRGWPRNVAYGLLGIMLILIGLVTVGTIGRFRDGTAFPPARQASNGHSLQEILEMSKLKGEDRDAAWNAMMQKAAEEEKRQGESEKKWMQQILTGREFKLFGIYTTICLISQFAIVALQSARVRL